jgi:hypothetical protein
LLKNPAECSRRDVGETLQNDIPGSLSTAPYAQAIAAAIAPFAQLFPFKENDTKGESHGGDLRF